MDRFSHQKNILFFFIFISKAIIRGSWILIRNKNSHFNKTFEISFKMRETHWKGFLFEIILFLKPETSTNVCYNFVSFPFTQYKSNISFWQIPISLFIRWLFPFMPYFLTFTVLLKICCSLKYHKLAERLRGIKIIFILSMSFLNWNRKCWLFIIEKYSQMENETHVEMSAIYYKSFIKRIKPPGKFNFQSQNCVHGANS